MSEWLNLDEVRWMEEALARNRKEMEGSRVVLQFWEPGVVPHALTVLQTGLAVLLDKRIVVVAPPGHPLPENLRRLAWRVLVRDIEDTADYEAMLVEIRDMVEREGSTDAGGN